MEEEAPNKRNQVAILIDHVFVLTPPPNATPPTPCVATSVSVSPGTASSPNPSTVRSCPRLSPDSSIATRKENASSPASMVNTPPWPYCPSLLRMLWSQIVATGSSCAGALGFTMLSAIWWLTNGGYCRITTVLLVQLAWVWSDNLLALLCDWIWEEEGWWIRRCCRCEHLLI
jgi:hypothetical protein